MTKEEYIEQYVAKAKELAARSYEAKVREKTREQKNKNRRDFLKRIMEWADKTECYGRGCDVQDHIYWLSRIFAGVKSRHIYMTDEEIAAMNKVANALMKCIDALKDDAK